MKIDAKSFAIAMLLLQAVSVALLWYLSVLSNETSGIFSVLLAANLVAFAVIVQVYRNPGEPEKEKPTTGQEPAPPSPSATQSSAPPKSG
jgi:hypothetical protein